MTKAVTTAAASDDGVREAEPTAEPPRRATVRPRSRSARARRRRRGRARSSRPRQGGAQRASTRALRRHSTPPVPTRRSVRENHRYRVQPSPPWERTLDERRRSLSTCGRHVCGPRGQRRASWDVGRTPVFARSGFVVASAAAATSPVFVQAPSGSITEDAMGSRTGRREFLGQVVAGAASLGVVRDAEAALTRAAAPSVVPGPGARPAGDLKRRVDLTAARLTRTGIPAYTDDFVLADVTLDERRRFWNFSGDLSGRYIEALSVLPPDGRTPGSLAPLVQRLLATQKADGRFGRPGLAFTEADTGTEHMALLWGNGRLLVGLMTYYEATRDPAVLDSARRLAGFLLAVREATKAPAVMKRVEGQGAFGFICFTQLSEGLAMLSRATGEKRYAEVGAEIVPLLQPRGVQHSHGYLSTLRGAVMLHDAGAPGDMLGFAQRLYGDLVRSGDYTLDGGVMEYFGWTDPANRALLAPAQDASGHDARNEGCGLADFVRLSLQLYEATGQTRLPGARGALPRQRIRSEPVRQRRLRLTRVLRPRHQAHAERGPRVVVLHDARLSRLPRHPGPRRRRKRRRRARAAVRGRRLRRAARRAHGPAHAVRRRVPVGPSLRRDARNAPAFLGEPHRPVPQRKTARGVRRVGVPPRSTEIRHG